MKRTYITFLTIMAIFLLIASYYDYTITDTLYNKLPLYATLAASVGVIPYYLSITCALTILNKNNKILIKIIVFVSSIIMFINMFNYIELNLVVECVVSIIFAIVYFGILNFIIKPHIVKLDNQVAKKMILLVVVSLLTIVVVKAIWARPRYEEILSGTHEFSSWFIINEGIATTDGVKSFVSGHTAAIFNSLFIVFLVPESIKNKVFIILLLICYIFAVGRLFSGSHFLSDITVSATIITSYFYLIYNSKLFSKSKL